MEDLKNTNTIEDRSNENWTTTIDDWERLSLVELWQVCDQNALQLMNLISGFIGRRSGHVEPSSLEQKFEHLKQQKKFEAWRNYSCASCLVQKIDNSSYKNDDHHKTNFWHSKNDNIDCNKTVYYNEIELDDKFDKNFSNVKLRNFTFANFSSRPNANSKSDFNSKSSGYFKNEAKCSDCLKNFNSRLTGPINRLNYYYNFNKDIDNRLTLNSESENEFKNTSKNELENEVKNKFDSRAQNKLKNELDNSIDIKLNNNKLTNTPTYYRDQIKSDNNHTQSDNFIQKSSIDFIDGNVGANQKPIGNNQITKKIDIFNKDIKTKDLEISKKNILPANNSLPVNNRFKKNNLIINNLNANNSKVDEFYNGSRIYDQKTNELKYSWSQNLTELDIVIPISKEVKTKSQCKIQIKTSHLSILINENNRWSIILNGQLLNSIRSNVSYWTLEPGKCIQIFLEKKQNKWWKSFLNDEPELNLNDLDRTVPFNELSEEEQNIIQQLTYQQIDKLKV